MIPRVSTLFIALLLLATTNEAAAQSAFPYIRYPRFITSYGLADQGAAVGDASVGLSYNPAAIARATSATLSIFRNPGFNNVAPITSWSMSTPVSGVGFLGIDYVGQSYPDFVVTSAASPDPTGTVSPSVGAIAVSGARAVLDDLSLGVTVRYAWMDVGSRIDGFLFSAGALYSPSAAGGRFTVGLSVLDLGPTIGPDQRELQEPPPSMIRLGVTAGIVDEPGYGLGLHLEGSKDLIGWTEAESPGQSYTLVQPRSGFDALFSDWHDAPRDIALHTGLSFSMKPLSLGGGVTLRQDFLVGVLSEGPRAGGRTNFTHGVMVGVGIEPVVLSLGYAGTWHEKDRPFLFRTIPQEVFQFSLSLGRDIVGNKLPAEASSQCERIITAAGVAGQFRVGRGTSNIGVGESPNTPAFSLEGDFYLTERSALVSTISYASVPWFLSTLEGTIEIFAFCAGFRHHPLHDIPQLFLQADLGLSRENPDFETYPGYFYRTSLGLKVGGVIPLAQEFVLMPSAGFVSQLGAIGGSAQRLGGYNHWEAGVSVGYSFAQ